MPCGVHNCMQQLDKMFVRVCRALKKRRRRRTIGSNSSGCVSSSPSLPMIAQVLLGSAQGVQERCLEKSKKSMKRSPGVLQCDDICLVVTGA